MQFLKCVRWLVLKITLLNFIILVQSLESNKRALSPLKTAATFKQFFQDNCQCEQNIFCRCCVKYQNNFFNVYQNLCSNLTVQRKTFEMRFEVALNDAVLFSNRFSGNNIPPICYPLLPPWPILGCIKINSVRQHDNNQIHACSNATLNIAGFDLLNFRLGCIDFGMAGVELVEPDHDLVNNEPTAEISLETSDAVTEGVLMKQTTEATNFITKNLTDLDFKRPLLCQENGLK